MSDSANEAVLTQRIPQDKFEIELFGRAIKAELDNWQKAEQPRFRAELGDYNPDDGTWKLYITKPLEDFGAYFSLDEPSLVGRIWMDEREYPASEYYRIAVSWELGSQSNTGMPPVLAWDLGNPAGPW